MRGGWRRFLKRAKKSIRRGRSSVVGIARRASSSVMPARTGSAGGSVQSGTGSGPLGRSGASDANMALSDAPESPKSNDASGSGAARWVEDESDEEDDWNQDGGAEERAIIRDAGHRLREVRKVRAGGVACARSAAGIAPQPRSRARAGVRPARGAALVAAADAGEGGGARCCLRQGWRACLCAARGGSVP